MTIRRKVISLQESGASASALPAEHRRDHSGGRPVEEIKTAGPSVNFGIANDAGETAGTLALKLLPGRGIVHAAAGAGELLEGPYAVGHGAIIRLRGRS